jgi:hypothetical protein
MAVVNALAYYDSSTITAVKSLIVHALGVRDMQSLNLIWIPLDTAGIYLSTI